MVNTCPHTHTHTYTHISLAEKTIKEMKYDTRNTRLIYNMEEVKGINGMKEKQKTVSNRKERVRWQI